MKKISDHYKVLIKEYIDLIQAMKEYKIDDTSCQYNHDLTVPKPVLPDSNIVLIFSPHPDDESIVSALLLRLARECGYRIINVAVTLGSKKERQLERLAELKDACAVLNYGLEVTGERCLESVNELGRGRDPLAWQHKVAVIGDIIKQYKPTCIMVPHRNDGHPTHAGTHLLVMDALQETGYPTFVCLTEFWRALKDPNLMIESSVDDVALMMAALSCHVGEIKRNQYHAFLPAWMTDNVRRGSELLDGAGAAAANIPFATLYHWLWFDGKAFASSKHENRIVELTKSLDELF